MTDLLGRLDGVRPNGEGWTARCPAHSDQHNSLCIHFRDGRWLLKCFAGCNTRSIVEAMGLNLADLFDQRHERGGAGILSMNRATAQLHRMEPEGPIPIGTATHQKPTDLSAAGLTIERYAAAKGLPMDFVKACGLSECCLGDRRAIRMPYFGMDGQLQAVRYRIALDGDRFRWKMGAKPCLYGLNRIGEARANDPVVLVEGESDAQTLWMHGISALGIPGASSWRDERDAPHLDGFGTIYVVLEADRGGEAVRTWLARSTIRPRVRLVRLAAKDVSALYLENPSQFPERWKAACLTAVPWTAAEAEEAAEERSKAWGLCQDLR